MAQAIITKEVFDFLRTLEKNNNREWFTEHKKQFKTLESAVKEVFATISEKMKSHDEIEKLKVFRIYRDVRFSHDKTPYKINFSASMSRAGAHQRGGYYVHLQPNGSFIAAGFWNPNKEDLLRIRKEWEFDAEELRKIIENKDFKDVWGELIGDEVKTAPKGFDREHPNIDLIRKKQFLFVKNFTDKEVLSQHFTDRANEAFKAIRPYFDLMSTVLTTNLNGESLLN
ncbi:DUF2461 domain-containing protein [Flavobacteriaceae bacterium TP-CH-4]|uniref:DUF2461 domain-containing protein n=1 Tax=Pelagihabitans pacificus TaxID=2696054 RepID=A0A967ATW0_9FLAO|nr:DUF2461 domain-containing protein [Pelagihabitans pacificus]NHF59842.1 DUF2461 domain-containing protein [Pelagihabitans pacificus]